MEAFFSLYPASRQIFNALLEAVQIFGQVEVQVKKSQVAFCRKKIFARVWVPEQYLHRGAAPLVLTLSFRIRDPSARWKEVVEPYPGRFTHHLELYDAGEIDDEVIAWLREAWAAAG
jgi:hypothetical protein